MPVGSGPWRFAQLASANLEGNQGSSGVPAPDTAPAVDGVVLEPNPYGTGPVSNLRLWFRPYPTFGAALTALTKGEVYGLGHIPADQLSAVEKVQGVTVHNQTLARYAMLLLNLQSPLFDKPETRQALEYAIDRQAIVNNALGGGGAAHKQSNASAILGTRPEWQNARLRSIPGE